MHQFKKTWSLYDRLGQIPRKRIKTLWYSMGLSSEMASLLRYEFDMLVLKLFNTMSFRFRRKLKILTNQTNLKIQLGCGRNVINDWVNIDCYAPSYRHPNILLCDLRGGIPLKDNCAIYIFTEHFIEHFEREYVSFLLQECFRVISPKGRIRVVCPDGGKLLRAYLEECHPLRSLFPLSQNTTWMDFINSIARGASHKYLYDEDTLTRDLRCAGFSKIKICSAGESDSPALLLDDSDLKRRQSSIYVEGMKE